MKKQGVPEDDPEFIKAHQLLSRLSQQSQIRKLKEQESLVRQRQAQQQHQLLQQQQQQKSANGINGSVVTAQHKIAISC